MRVWGGEMVEEVLTPGQQIVTDPEVLEQGLPSAYFKILWSLSNAEYSPDRRQ